MKKLFENIESTAINDNILLVEGCKYLSLKPPTYKRRKGKKIYLYCLAIAILGNYYT